MLGYITDRPIRLGEGCCRRASLCFAGRVLLHAIVVDGLDYLFPPHEPLRRKVIFLQHSLNKKTRGERGCTAKSWKQKTGKPQKVASHTNFKLKTGQARITILWVASPFTCKQCLHFFKTY